MGNWKPHRKRKYGSVIVPRFDYIKHEFTIANTENREGIAYSEEV